MDVGHRGASGVDDLVDEDDFKLGKLRSESSTQVTDSLGGDDNNDECNGSEAADPSGPKQAVNKCLEKSATYPCSDDKVSSLDTSNDEDPDTELQSPFSKEPLQRSKSMPPVSAMKGSREKVGKEVRQLSVTWAPDVYDPVPNSLCHTVKSSGSKKKSRRDREKDKKNGKRGQKGSNNSSSRGGSSKDKKQTRRKHDKSYKHDISEDVYADPPGSLGYDVASSDMCGSSFLKKTVREFHYPVAEAL